VSVPADRKESGPPGGRRLLRLAPLGLLAVLLQASPATAQFTGNVAIDSDYRLRGYSLTDGHAAASAQVGYDHSSGAYVSILGLTELGGANRFLGVVGNAGYSRRINPHITLDAGLLRSQIRTAYPLSSGFEYTEVYAGAYVGPVAGRIYYSPDYRRQNQSTIYGELEAGFEPAAHWRVTGHVGLLTYLSSTTFYRAGDTHRDWRISVGRRLGRAELHAALSGGGPSTYYGSGLHKKAVFTLGASVGF
jgi:uncharacterized protein (TIGR02001 family)